MEEGKEKWNKRKDKRRKKKIEKIIWKKQNTKTTYGKTEPILQDNICNTVWIFPNTAAVSPSLCSFAVARNWLLLRKMREETSRRKCTGFTTCDALPHTVLSPRATEGINVSSGLVFASGVLKPPIGNLPPAYIHWKLRLPGKCR
jgi:hypothetical protein